MASPQHLLRVLQGVAAPALADDQALSALVIAAAGAIGLTPHGPPTARAGPAGIAVGLLGHGGHVVLHAEPAAGTCLVDVVTPGRVAPARALEVIARRLGVRADS